MIVPSQRLLAFTGATLLPLALAFAASPEAAPALGGLALVGAAVAVADALAGPRRLRALRAALPPVVRLTRAKPGRVEVTVGGAPIGGLRIGLPLPSEIECESPERRVAERTADSSAEDTTVPFEVVPRRTGRWAVAGLRAEVASPLGFWDLRTSLPASTELRVYPNLLAEKKAAATLFLNRGRAGLHVRRQVGKGREFEKLRDWVAGDAREDVHWKATARRARLVTKEYRTETTQEVYVVVDASRLSGRPALDAAGQPGSTTLDRFVAAALLLGAATEQQGDRFGLVTFADRVEGFVRAGSGRAHFRACRDVLALLAPRPVVPAFDELLPFLAGRLSRRSLVVLLSELDDAAIAETFLAGARVLARRHLVLAVSLLPATARPLFGGEDRAATVDDVYARLAGHLQWRTLRQLERSLARLGVTFALLPHESVAADLIARYLAVKGRQAL
ncbi:MAG TPA: DUF58 domain-containing protein [Thermoanaerobaculia bacterium]|jgi:uncharacterized protein (DUF58 family)|nr:DUF58 domain-containing protein [Thermoanaerobaculia bacterium]HPA50648.1 DUF58 domain-containing protein [Thermoanaerobaculia bacterium]HQN07425.1 DUF58 domain-containing protein [Thermoanaerobaculia bacterium]HQP85719.1 DUF58 domain-containing protein [Thermoanaerobaculia bacterium]